MRYVIATHGYLAEGYKSAIGLLSGMDHIHTVNAYVEEQKEVAEELERLLQSFDSGERVLVLTDVLGGSVTQAVSGLIGKYPLFLVTGINLGLVMELVQKGDMLTDEMIGESIGAAREQMVCVNHVLESC